MEPIVHEHALCMSNHPDQSLRMTVMLTGTWILTATILLLAILYLVGQAPMILVLGSVITMGPLAFILMLFADKE